MTDRVNKEIRKKIMQSNRGKNTGPEMIIRKALFSKGLRYRIHERRLPGKPDLVFAKYRAVVFVHGCYWHGHDCSRSPHARSNESFWQNKIQGNKMRDLQVQKDLLNMGWRVLIVWECAVRRRKPPFEESDDLNLIVSWLNSDDRLAVLSDIGFQKNM